MALDSPAIGPGTCWELDADNTAVDFSVRKFRLITVRGRFRQVRGTLELRGTALTDAVVKAEIDAASIETGMDRRDTHLRGEDFLDVERYPTITFRSTRTEALSEDRLRIHGHLTIRGLTRQVALDAELNGREPERADVVVRTTLDRRDFGLTWNFLGLMVGDAVDVAIALELRS